jgi:hypothetical protein
MIGQLALLLMVIFPQGADTGRITLHDGDIPGLVVKQTQHYDGASLTGYINGGAELYREYGFRTLTVQEVTLRSGEELTIESYRMTDPAAAFGIFSVSRSGCEPADTAFLASCTSPFQLQLVARDLYVRIQNGSGTVALKESSRLLARWIVARAGQEIPALPPRFTHPLLLPFVPGAKRMAGPLGLQNGLPDWAEPCEGLWGFSLFALPAVFGGRELSVLVWRFGSPEDCGIFLGRIGVEEQGAGLMTVPRGAGTLRVKRQGPLECTLVETGEGGLEPGLQEVLFGPEE